MTHDDPAFARLYLEQRRPGRGSRKVTQVNRMWLR